MNDFWVLAPVGMGALIMLRWAQAYFLFPRSLEKSLDGISTGPITEHVVGVGRFVRWCAHAHWIMALRDAAMIALMVSHFMLAHDFGVFVLWITLIPLIAGAEYSHHRAVRLAQDAKDINQFVKAVQRVAGK